MTETAAETAEATVSVRLWVHRGTEDGLAAAAREVLAAVEGVEEVVELEIRGIEPGATDIRLTVHVRLRFLPVDGDSTSVERLRHATRVSAVTAE